MPNCELYRWFLCAKPILPKMKTTTNRRDEMKKDSDNRLIIVWLIVSLWTVRTDQGDSMTG